MAANKILPTLSHSAQDLQSEWIRQHDQLAKGHDENPLRLRRAITWLEEAENASSPHVQLVLLWIAFNALYGKDRDVLGQGGKGSMNGFLKRIIRQDSDEIIFIALRRLRNRIKTLMLLLPSYDKFWRVMYCPSEREEWGNYFRVFNEENERVIKFLNQKKFDTKELIKVTGMIFNRLYVVRNQSMYGAATKGNKLFVSHVNAGVALLSELVPRIALIMLRAKERHWGKIPYPRTGTPNHPGPPPQRFEETNK